MHIACVLELEQRLLPSMGALAVAIEAKAQEWMDVPKTGQTHLQDATPLTVGQEWSGYATQLRDAIERVRGSEGGLFRARRGRHRGRHGTQRPPDFSKEIAAKISELTGRPRTRSPTR
jgi:fumarate hydratase class II